MDREEERLKLEFDLLCWYNFYQKCHELENMVDIKDEGYYEYDNKEVLPDITIRNYTFGEYSKKEYLNEVYQEFINKNDDYQNEYKIFKNQINQNISECSAKIKEHNKKIKKSYGISIIIGMIPGFIIMCSSFKSASAESAFGKIFLGAVIFGIGAVFGGVIENILFDKKNSETLTNLKNDENNYKILLNLTYKGWFEKYKHTVPEISNEWERIKKEFNNSLIEYQKFSSIKIEELKEIKEKLKQDIPLPDKYSDEYHVKCLLSLVLDKRADTLKEAINLFEEEAYRSRVIQSLDLLNYNIGLLNRNISQLRYELDNSMRQLSSQMNVMIAQNFVINNQLQAINCSTRYLMIDSLLSND